MRIFENRDVTRFVAQNANFIAMAAVGAVAVATVFTTGFMQSPVVHEIFHDVRHAMGLPCH